jgi:hypothetical protein
LPLSSTKTSKALLRAAALAALFFAAPLRAQETGKDPGQTPPPSSYADPAILAAEIEKMRAYAALLDRTGRAVQSLERYDSWVDMKKGPTGRERYIDYGLYETYDVRAEIEAAIAAANGPVPHGEIDQTAMRYVAAYSALAQVLSSASRYYDRKDYKRDQLAQGKAFHEKIVLGAETFLAERRSLEEQLLAARQGIDGRELSAIEQSEGQTPRWHIRKVVIAADHVLALLPTDVAAPVKLDPFRETLEEYARAVAVFEALMREDPDAVSFVSSAPGDLLARLREVEEQLAAAKGKPLKGIEAEMALTQAHSFHDMLRAQADAALMTMAVQP